MIPARELAEWVAYFNLVESEQKTAAEERRKGVKKTPTRQDNRGRAMGDRSREEQQAEFDAEFGSDGILNSRK